MLSNDLNKPITPQHNPPKFLLILTKTGASMANSLIALQIHKKMLD